MSALRCFSAPQSYLAHTLLAYQRAQEDQADRAGVRFLTMTGQSAKGMYDTFKRFADEMMFTAAYVDPYVQNHPMPAERMAALAELVKTPYWDKKDPPELQFRHDMMRAKLYGFIERADDCVAALSNVQHQSASALRPRDRPLTASATCGPPSPRSTSLIQAMPNNPYFYELEGQALLENGHAAEAIAPLRRAVELAPNPALIQILLGQALIATNNPKLASEAVPLLQAALIKEPESGDAYEQLAMAYGHNGKLAEADLASAQAAFARGDNKTARELAARAKTRFPVGSPGWVRADDIVAFNKGKKPPAIRSITKQRTTIMTSSPRKAVLIAAALFLACAGASRLRRRFPPISVRRSGPSSRSICWRIRK